VLSVSFLSLLCEVLSCLLFHLSLHCAEVALESSATDAVHIFFSFTNAFLMSCVGVEVALASSATVAVTLAVFVNIFFPDGETLQVFSLSR
jgi:hypothetical protein